MSGPLDLRERAVALAAHAQAQRAVEDEQLRLAKRCQEAREAAKASGFTPTQVWLVAHGCCTPEQVVAMAATPEAL